MNRITTALLASASFFVALTPALAADDNWTNAAAVYSPWTTGANWDLGTAPTGGQTADISNGGWASINSAVTFNTLSIGGTSRLELLNGADLTGGGAITNNSQINADNTAAVTVGNVISGTGALNLGAGSILILTGANTYSGTTTIAAGASLTVGNNGTTGVLGSGAIVDNGSLIYSHGFPSALTLANVISGTGSFTVNGFGGLILTGANTYSGGTTISSSSQLTIQGAGTVGTGTVVDNGFFVLNPGGAFTLANAISGSGAVTVQSGPITLTNVVYSVSGTTTISSGATLQFGNGTTVLSTVISPITDNGALIFNASSTSSFQGLISGTGSVTINSGQMTVSAANTYTGGTTISSGTLNIGTGGTTGSVVGNIVDNGTLLFRRSDAVTFAGVVSGTGALIQSGSTSAPASSTGVLTLTGVNTYTGRTSTNPGTTIALSGSGSVAASAFVRNFGTFDISQTTSGATIKSLEELPASGVLPPGVVALGSKTLTIANGVSEYDGVIQDGGIGGGTGGNLSILAGTEILAGTNTYTGTTTIASGATLQIGNGGTSGTLGAGAVTNNGTLAFNRPGGTVANVISGTGAVSFAAGTTILTGTGTYTGGTTIASGATLQLGNGGTTGQIAGTGIVDNGALVYNRSNSAGITGVISGTGSLRVMAGTLSLNADNTYSGGTTIDSGATLALPNGGVVGSVVGNVVDNGTFNVNHTGASATYAGVISGTGNVIFAGNNTLTAAQTYTGVTSQNSNTLILSGAGSIAGTSSLELSGFRQAGFDISAITASGTSVGSLASCGNDRGVTCSSGDTTAMAGSTVTLGNKTLTLTNAAGNFLGIINGTGGIAVSGGTETLSGVNTYSGGTSITGSGVLAVAADNALGGATGGLTLGNGGTLRFGSAFTTARTTVLTGTGGGFDTNGNTDTVSGVISGTSLTVADSSTAKNGVLIISGANTYTGSTTVSGGTLRLGAANALPVGSNLVLQGGKIDFNGFSQTLPSLSGSGTLALGSGNVTVGSDNSNTTFSGVITGTGGLTKAGSGTLILNGANTYTGPTTVSIGVLEVGDAASPGASINGPVTITSGGTLSGHGTINGSVTVGAGGNFQPGGTIGTINVGSTTFASGSTYTVETNAAGQGNNTIATGAITINSGTTLAVTPDAPLASYGRITNYTILQAAGGITGTFSNVTNSATVFTTNVAYAPNAVTLTLVRPDLLANAATTLNQASIGTAIAATANALRTTLAPQSDAAVQAGFNQLSGDIHASLRSAAVEDSRIIRDTVLDHLGKSSDSLMVWGAGFGGYGSISTDGNASGLHHDTAGFIAGADMPVGEGFRLGLAGGYTGNNASVTGKTSTASGNSGHVVAYGGWSDGMVDLKLGGDFGFGTVNITRTVAAFSQVNTNSQDQRLAQVFGDAGYKFQTARAMVEPYVGIASISATTGGFAETGGTTALSGNRRTDTQTYSTVGLRASLAPMSLDPSLGGITPHVDMAWQHGFNGFRPGQVETIASLSQSFTVLGAPLARDAAAVRAGFDLAITPEAVLSLDYDGSFASRVQNNAIRGALQWKF